MATRRTDPYSRRHHHQRIARNADQTEFSALLVEVAVVDAGMYDDRVAGAMDDFDPKDTTVHEEWHRTDLEYDTAVGGIHEEIERRANMMEGAYPFTLTDGTLTYRASKNLVYEFCLAICNSPTITEGPYVELPRIFERLSAKIFQQYLGVHTLALHTGWPRDGKSRFKTAMQDLGDKSGEWTWSPEPDLPDDPEEKDGGVDFVAWKKALDNRKVGQLFLLGQCACGNDWNTKFNDLRLDKFKKWFRPSVLVEPVRAFVIPFVLSDGNLKEASREAGLVFDRARLVLAAAAIENDSGLTEWSEKLEKLIGLVKEAP